MGRYTGSKCRLCRREGVKLFLKGDRCYSPKCALSKRPYAPGQHGRFRRRATQFAIHLREKQKAKRVYRAGFAYSRDQARQLITHGHFLVNGRHLNVPSYLVKEGDLIEVRPQSKDKLRELIKAAVERKPLPSWLSRDLEALRIQVASEPSVEELDQSIETSLIVEFYSR